MMKYCENCNCKETRTPPCTSSSQGVALSDAELEDIYGWKGYTLDRFKREVRAILSRASSSRAEGWLRACDQALVCANLGIANADDTFEVAQDKLRQLIEWEIAVAIDPKVNGGYVLTKESK